MGSVVRAFVSEDQGSVGALQWSDLCRRLRTWCPRERGCLQAVFLTEYMGSNPGSLGRKGGLDLAVTAGAFQERPVESC